MSNSLVGDGVRQFDLYDFFSVLLPGSAFLFALYPLLPVWVSINSFAIVVPILMAGFVVGRALHAGAVFVERGLNRQSHRGLFAEELERPSMLSVETMDAFYKECEAAFPHIGLSGSRAVDAKNERTCTTLYALVRGYVHFDGRGRSRTFQAIHAFFRSTELVMGLLTLVYSVYVLAAFQKGQIGVPVQGVLPYPSKIAELQLTPGVIELAVLLVVLSVRTTFKYAKYEYKEYYIQYLLTDFLTLRTLTEDS